MKIFLFVLIFLIVGLLGGCTCYHRFLYPEYEHLVLITPYDEIKINPKKKHLVPTRDYSGELYEHPSVNDVDRKILQIKHRIGFRKVGGDIVVFILSQSNDLIIKTNPESIKFSYDGKNYEVGKSLIDKSKLHEIHSFDSPNYGKNYYLYMIQFRPPIGSVNAKKGGHYEGAFPFTIDDEKFTLSFSAELHKGKRKVSCFSFPGSP